MPAASRPDRPAPDPPPVSPANDSRRSAVGDAAVELLRKVVAAKSGGEVRLGQEQMARAVAEAFHSGDHLLVEAGTGIGKSLGYLVAAVAGIASGDIPGTVIIATATKALQEQLIDKDLPFLADALAAHAVTFTYALLKGRPNYACRSRLAELERDGGASADLFTSSPGLGEVDAVIDWATNTETGDRSDYRPGFSDALWRGVSISSGECPGASKCAFGSTCFAEAARKAAATVDVLVVNTALYSAHLASGGHVLPDHAVLIVDEAHRMIDIVADSYTTSMTTTRLLRALSRGNGILGLETSKRLQRDAMAFDVLVEPFGGRSVRGCDEPFASALAELRGALTAARSEAGAYKASNEQSKNRAAQLQTVLEGLVEDVDLLLDPTEYGTRTAWVDGGERRALMMAPVDVGPILATELFPACTVVATSATLAYAGEFAEPARRLGLTRPTPGLDTPPPHRGLVVESPFNYEKNSYLYVPGDLPEPRDPNFGPASHREIAQLAQAAGGRTLALFTSHAAMKAAAEYLRVNTDLQVLMQGDGGRAQLLEDFCDQPGKVLCATQSYWTGVDLPGDVLTCVIIDKVPFPRPDDPLIRARRDAATRDRQSSFHTVDLPMAATLLAQGAGRLIRSTTDRGIVAVLDKRLRTANYGRQLVDSLPPMTKKGDREFVLRALAWLNDQATAGDGVPRAA